jgi:hypothetical protein
MPTAGGTLDRKIHDPAEQRGQHGDQTRRQRCALGAMNRKSKNSHPASGCTGPGFLDKCAA